MAGLIFFGGKGASGLSCFYNVRVFAFHRVVVVWRGFAAP